MSPFKNYTFTWWQMGVFKLALLSIGVLIGSRWYEFFNENVTAVLIVAVVATACSMYFVLKR